MLDSPPRARLRGRVIGRSAVKPSSAQRLARGRQHSLLLLLMRGRLSPGSRGAVAFALVAVFVLIVAAAALAVRLTGGFLGSAAQSRNREARDVADSAFAVIQSILNDEENRYLWVAGNGNAWSSSIKNPCADYESNGDPKDDPLAPSNAALALNNPSSDPIEITDGDSSKKFKVESIDYFYSEVDSSGAIVRKSYAGSTTSSGLNIPDTILSGRAKPRMRVTLTAYVYRNGQEVSKARVAREFEVVPKCCKNSFGSNARGGPTAYGNDLAECIIGSGGGESAVITGLGGDGVLDVSGNKTFDIYNYDGELVDQAACWSGELENTLGFSYPDSGSNCQTGGIGYSEGTISLKPASFDWFNIIDEFIDGVYNGSAAFPDGTIGAGNINIGFGSNPSSLTVSIEEDSSDSDKLKVYRNDNSSMPWSACLEGPPKSSGVPVFYCRISNIVMKGSGNLTFDTSNGDIVLVFDGSSGGIANSGSGGISHVHNGNSNLCTAEANIANLEEKLRIVSWQNPDGEFDLRGTTSALAMEIYAPYGTVIWKGGGNADPNFCGRLWVNDLEMNGNIKMRVDSTSQSECPPSGPLPDGSCPSSRLNILDYKGRSFTHAHGF